MKVLVTGSAGHLGEALLRTFATTNTDAIGVDIKATPYTTHLGSLVDREFVADCMQGVTAVIHTATLHKPHVATHTRQAFVDTNISGTLNLLEAAVQHKTAAFIYTSTTSAFGDAMHHSPGEPAVWVDETLRPVPKNIYGVTKIAAEDLCQLFARNYKLPSLVLRTSRFFPEEDDSANRRQAYSDANLKVNELLHRRVDITDVVEAHLVALQQVKRLHFDRFIITATTPFSRDDQVELSRDASAVVARYCPEFPSVYKQLGWQMYPEIDRIYDNACARLNLGWQPHYNFAKAIELLADGQDYRSPLTQDIGVKRYHEQLFEDGPFPVEDN